jgi:lysozyme family protein
VNLTYDSSQLRFERAFWSYLNGAALHTRTAYQAFTYAMSIGGYSAPDSANPFQPNWWGNPNYNGTAG